MIEPLQNLLVPLDGSRLAEAVLPPGFATATACGSTVTLLHVIEHQAPKTVHGEPHLHDPAGATRYLDGVSNRFAQSGVPVESHVHPNEGHDVARSIADHADELGADLILLATHGSGGVRDLLFGSIAQQVLQQSTKPVLLVRPEHGYPDGFRYQSIMVPLDGTADSEMVLPMAVMLASRTGARLHLVRVVPTRSTLPGTSGAVATFLPGATSALLEIEGCEARDYLDVLKRRLPDVTSVEVRRGDVARELARAAAGVGADLIMMSTHGRAGIESYWAGSIAARILSRYSRPLLLMRIPQNGVVNPDADLEGRDTGA